MLQQFKPHRWPPPDGGDAGHYADLFGFFHARCQRTQEQAAAAAAAPSVEGGGEAVEPRPNGDERSGASPASGLAAPATPPTWPTAVAGHDPTGVAGAANANDDAAAEDDAKLESICAAAEKEYALTGSAQKAAAAAAAAASGAADTAPGDADTEED